VTENGISGERERREGRKEKAEELTFISTSLLLEGDARQYE